MHYFESFHMYNAFQKNSGVFCHYVAKWGCTKLKYSTLKVLLGSWSSCSKQTWIRSFKWGTIRLSMTIYSKVIGCQSLRSKNYSRPFGFEATFLQVVYWIVALRAARVRILNTADFEALQFCIPLVYKFIHYLFWKPYYSFTWI